MPRSSACVLDASAVIALLNREKGHENIEALLDDAYVSAVNLAEIVSTLAKRGLDHERIKANLKALGLTVVPFDEALAYRVGTLRNPTSKLGLSLGDRACLATAASLQKPAITTDRVWKKLDIGVDIRVIR